MDWFLNPNDRQAAVTLRRQLADFLRRHAAKAADVDDAELAIEELIGNAVRHTTGPVWVSLDWSNAQPTLTVSDLGEDFDLEADLPDDPLSEEGRGLYLAAHLTDDLELVGRRAVGNQVSATLRIPRRDEESFAPPRNSLTALPDLEEADPGGTFGRETFLRALVVQLAHAVEGGYGPLASQWAIAQVGTDTGSQMEEAYRAADGIIGQLTPEQMADCYVRLKHAIDGGFYVIEADEQRIVLGNTACPFGELVQRSPSLCRMTSSVFGGIAARNAGGANVILEERIAVGDPGCRVIVELGPESLQNPTGHKYPAPEDPDDDATVSPDAE